MIKFFRRIRQSLISENRFSKYLIYAIGEIVLVVIGILIALQINNLNEARKAKEYEQVILSNLHNGLKETQIALNIEKTNTERAYSAGEKLLQMAGKITDFEERSIDSLLFNMFPGVHFFVQTNTIDKLTQSGEINLVTDSKIKQLLIEWNTIQKKLVNREDYTRDWVQDEVLPYLAQYASYKQMDDFANLPHTGKSSIKKDYGFMLNDLRFENLISNVLFGYYQKINHLKEAEQFITTLTEATEIYKN